MNQTKQTKIWLIEGHEELRTVFSSIINMCPDFLCASYANGEDAIKELEESAPDLILMDIDLPGMNGIECTHRIKKTYPDILILMCTEHEDTEKIISTLQAGAGGYLLKKDASETLIEAIRELLRGGAPMNGDIARKVVNSLWVCSSEKSNDACLTNKENEILDLLSKGYSNKKIAGCLFVSVNTVRTHIYRIYEKLQVHNRVEALNKFKKATS